MRVLDEIMLDQPDPVRLAFLEVLNWILHADGVVDDRERRFLDDSSRMLGFPGLREALPDRPDDWKGPWSELLAPVGTCVLMQGALLAWADGELHDTERAMLDRLASELAVAPKTYARILTWAVDGHRWMLEGVSILARPRPVTEG